MAGGSTSVAAMAAQCVFCSIATGDIPADVVYSDDDVVAFRDQNPQAPTHVLVIPRTHVADLGEAANDPALTVALVNGIGSTARALALTDHRVVFNTGAGAGQSVFHVHAHVLAGRPLTWPPG